ncbi:MAG: hypothetical protein AAFQ14_10865 [Cyanobacteria bacterium J06621_12]
MFLNVLFKLLSGGFLAVNLVSQPLLAEQKIRQQGNTSATAAGNNNFAASQVHQSATQNRLHNSRRRQVTEQRGESRAAANGQDNTVVSDIDQDSRQNQAGRSQRAKQTATGNAAATGRNNRIISNTGQYNLQNQWKY